MKLHGIGSRGLSVSSLMHMTKAEIIKDLDITTKNWRAAEERCNQQYENIKNWQPVIHGYWVDQGTVQGAYESYNLGECSICHYDSMWDMISGQYNFCPYCGAKMDRKEIL